MATAKKKTAAASASPVTFSKAKILTLQRYAKRRDLLFVLLEDGKNYTFDQVDTVIKNFMKG